MTQEQIEKLMKLDEEGCYFMWKAGPYVDGFASVWTEDGEAYISSQVYSKTNLKEIPARQIKVYRPVEFS